MGKFIEYEKALLEIEGHSIFAESAQLGAEGPLTPIKSITGGLMRYAPDGPVKGTLQFTHYLTGALHDFLNPLTAVEWTGEPLSGNLGGMTFKSGYIRELEFSVSPFEPISVRSSMDLYGELEFMESGKSDVDIRNRRALSHGAKSYLAGDELGINQKLSFSYSVSCSRNPEIVIGSGLPLRVTKENVRINMNIQGENLGRVLKETGNAATMTAYIYDVYGNPEDSALATFSCTGQVFSQNLSVANRNYMVGSISMAQDYSTGRAVI